MPLTGAAEPPAKVRRVEPTPSNGATTGPKVSCRSTDGKERDHARTLVPQEPVLTVNVHPHLASIPSIDVDTSHSDPKSCDPGLSLSSSSNHRSNPTSHSHAESSTILPTDNPNLSPKPVPCSLNSLSPLPQEGLLHKPSLNPHREEMAVQNSAGSIAEAGAHAAHRRSVQKGVCGWWGGGCSQGCYCMLHGNPGA